MTLNADEKWHIIPASLSAPHGISVRHKDGSFRTPTARELEDLVTCQKRAHELATCLADALGMLRFFVTIAEVTAPDEVGIAHVKMKRLAEALSRSGYIS